MARVSTGSKLVTAVIGGALFMAYAIYVRGLLIQHALIIGFAGAGLVYFALRAVDNLRRLR